MKMSLRFTVSGVLALIMGSACFGQHYTQTNLVSNEAGVAPVTDPQLINPWGISRGAGTPWWVSDQRTGSSTLYNGGGTKESLIVVIPPADPNNKNTPTGTPTGTIFNGSQTDFLLAPAKPAIFFFSTNDRTIAGWNPAVAATLAVTVVKTTDGSSYTGLTSAFINGKPFLYAANFNKGRVDVYDNSFRPVKLTGGHSDRDAGDDEDRSSENSFADENLPRGYVPFNVQAIGNDIVVTYALHEEGARLDASAMTCSSGSLRVGGILSRADSFAAYDLATGKFDGLLQDASGKPLAINGVWALSPGNVSANNSDAAAAPAGQMYFTAGPNHGSGGLLGYLTAASAELTEGNDQ